MNFVKTPDKILISPYDNIEFYDAEIMTVYFETNPEILKKILNKKQSVNLSELKTIFDKFKRILSGNNP